MGEWLLPLARLLHPNLGGGDLRSIVGVPTHSPQIGSSVSFQIKSDRFFHHGQTDWERSLVYIEFGTMVRMS